MCVVFLFHLVIVSSLSVSCTYAIPLALILNKVANCHPDFKGHKFTRGHSSEKNTGEFPFSLGIHA